MQPSLLGTFTGIAFSFLFWWSPLQGQWVVGAEFGSDRFWGGSRETSAERRSFRPYRPTTIGIGLERQGGSIGVALRLRYSSAGLALEGSEAVVAAKGIFTNYSASPELVYSLTAVGSVNHLRVHVGPLFEVWTVRDEDSQTRVGVQGAVSLDVPLGGRLAASFLGGAAVTSSPFAKDQLDSGFERRPLWRRSAAAGLKYRI